MPWPEEIGINNGGSQQSFPERYANTSKEKKISKVFRKAILSPE